MAPDRPVFRQAQTSRGITVGDDVWIGSHMVVVDGVTIGDHCVIGAGAVVTKEMPPWTVAAGNPARRIRDRREPGADRRRSGNRYGGEDRLARFAATARAQAVDILDMTVGGAEGFGRRALTSGHRRTAGRWQDEPQPFVQADRLSHVLDNVAHVEWGHHAPLEHSTVPWIAAAPAHAD
ncbi:acyltransferase [Streptomyces ossamyceticus]|jgi:hypothetical protein|uniref:Acyltransferase n=1 Tax=Streptomyces ossamyceticus TaxID=249581 RepID=A0ABV2UY41_9ACTN